MSLHFFQSELAGSWNDNCSTTTHENLRPIATQYDWWISIIYKQKVGCSEL